MKADRSLRPLVLAVGALAVLGIGATAQDIRVPTFVDLARAETTLTLRLHQTRRVHEPAPGSTSSFVWTSLDESLVIAPDPAAGGQRFSLEFEGINGQAGSPYERDRRRELYRGYAGYLHLYASLRISDPALASQNYTIVYVDSRQLLGRPTHRLAILPRRIGHNPWVVEVDAQTNYPLVRAEFDVSGRLVSTLEVTQFEIADPAALSDVAWWRPQRRIDSFTTVDAAITALRSSALVGGATDPQVALTIPLASDLPSGYRLTEVRVVHEDLRPEASLVLTYSDGIDDLFVVETLNAPPPRLQVSTSSSGAYAIYVYQDQNVAQFMFHTNGVQTLIVGRAGQFALGPLASNLLAQSLGR